MRDFYEYKKDYNSIKIKDGEKIFIKQLQSLQGTDVFINNVSTPIKGFVVNEENINSPKDEFRTLCVEKAGIIKHGDEILYNGEYYLIITEIDDHYYYKCGKIKKCNNKLTWKMNEIIYECPCILNNNSYGVKILSDNSYVRSQNIKAQITVQNNEFTEGIIPDTRFMFNNSEFDIYNVIDVNRSVTKGLITFTAEKSIIRFEDDLKDNVAFSNILLEGNTIISTSPTYSYAIEGVDSFIQENSSTFTINPLTSCTFYINDFDSNNISYITNDDGNGTCIVYGKPNIADNWFTLYAKDINGNILTSKKINVVKE